MQTYLIHHLIWNFNLSWNLQRKWTKITLNLSSNIAGDCNIEKKIFFLHKLLLTNVQVSKPHKAFANGESANIKFSKTQLHKSGRFLGRLLGLLGNVLKPLAKSVLIPLGLTPAASAADVAIHKNNVQQ